MPPPGDSRRISFFGIGELWSKGEPNSGQRSKGGENLVSNLKLLSDKEVYRPGDSVSISIELENPARHPLSSDNNADEGNGNGFGLLVERLSFEFKGIEKLDTQWFLAQKPLPGSKQRRDTVQTVLPTTVPPSHKGATVRYLYYVRVSLHGRWLVSENGYSNRDSIRDSAVQEARLPLQIWGSQNGNDYLAEDGESEGSFPSQTIQMDMYWKEEMEGDSDWVRANETCDGIDEDYESSRDEISSVSSYNPARESIHKAFGSSLSLQSPSSRLQGREALHAEADEVSQNSTGGGHRSFVKSFSRDDDTGGSAASGNLESATPTSEGFIRGRSYNIRLDDQVLLRFSPKKFDSNYYFGDMIGGTLTFFHKEGARRCLEVSVTLEISESVNRRFVHPSRRNSPTITKVHSDFYEVVADLLQTSFLFSIPMDGPMSFSTPHISVQWALRFEFFTTTKNDDWTRYDHPLLVEERDKCEWVLPITVHAPQPGASATQNQSRRNQSLQPLWTRNAKLVSVQLGGSITIQASFFSKSPTCR
ncbi:hypothetical protein V2J09_011543 [Rumex salicifolius]